LPQCSLAYAKTLPALKPALALACLGAPTAAFPDGRRRSDGAAMDGAEACVAFRASEERRLETVSA